MDSFKLMNAMLDSLRVAKNTYDALPPLKEGIKPIYHRVLNALYRSGNGYLRVSDLSDVLDIQLPNMTNIVNEMMNKNLLIKVRSPQDKRAVHIHMSEEGEAYFNQHVLVYREKMLEEFSRLDQQECLAMIKSIHNMQDIIYRAYGIKGE